MAPSPLIKMSLYLTGKDIIYLPNKHEIYDTFNTILEEIVHIMSTIPRLFEKFALPSGGLKRFLEVIQTEPDCNKLQSLIDEGIFSKILCFLYINKQNDEIKLIANIVSRN